jgi:hypothetical protein
MTAAPRFNHPSSACGSSSSFSKIAVPIEHIALGNHFFQLTEVGRLTTGTRGQRSTYRSAISREWSGFRYGIWRVVRSELRVSAPFPSSAMRRSSCLVTLPQPAGLSRTSRMLWDDFARNDKQTESNHKYYSARSGARFCCELSIRFARTAWPVR